MAPPLRLGLKAKLITKKALGDIFQSHRAFSASNPRERDLRSLEDARVCLPGLGTLIADQPG